MRCRIASVMQWRYSEESIARESISIAPPHQELGLAGLTGQGPCERMGLRTDPKDRKRTDWEAAGEFISASEDPRPDERRWIALNRGASLHTKPGQKSEQRGHHRKESAIEGAETRQ